MTALRLIRRDPARNMARFYTLDIQGDLFGGWSLVREWGRIGRAGQVRATPYPTPAEATAAFDRQRQAKQRRGYVSDRKGAASPTATTSCLGGGGADAPPDRCYNVGAHTISTIQLNSMRHMLVLVSL